MPCGQTQSMVWCGMMAQYKDVGPGSGPSLVALFEGEGWMERENGQTKNVRDGRESTLTAPTAHSKVDPPKEWKGCITKGLIMCEHAHTRVCVCMCVRHGPL